MFSCMRNDFRWTALNAQMFWHTKQKVVNLHVPPKHTARGLFWGKNIMFGESATKKKLWQCYESEFGFIVLLFMVLHGSHGQHANLGTCFSMESL